MKSKYYEQLYIAAKDNFYKMKVSRGGDEVPWEEQLRLRFFAGLRRRFDNEQEYDEFLESYNQRQQAVVLDLHQNLNLNEEIENYHEQSICYSIYRPGLPEMGSINLCGYIYIAKDLLGPIDSLDYINIKAILGGAFHGGVSHEIQNDAMYIFGCDTRHANDYSVNIDMNRFNQEDRQFIIINDLGNLREVYRDYRYVRNNILDSCRLIMDALRLG